MTDKKTLFLFSFLSVLFGTLTVLFGDLALPFAAAALASLIIVDKGQKKTVALVIIFVIAITNIIVLVAFDGIASLSGIVAALFAIVISLFYSNKLNKAEAAAVMTVIYSLLFLVCLYLSATNAVSTFDINAVIDYYENAISTLKAELFAAVEQAASSMSAENGVVINLEEVSALIDNFVAMSVSLLAVLGFALAGLSFKLFTAFQLKTGNSSVLDFRFSTSNVFAYFFLVIYFVSSFVSYETLVGVALLNLSNIFTFVYAYLGFCSLLSFMSARRSSKISVIIAVLLIVAFSSFAVGLLSLIGAFSVIRKNRMQIKS